MYTQLAFALDRVKALAPQHPEWKDRQPFKAVLDGDMKALAATGEKGLLELVMATHAGMTTDEFDRYRDGLAGDRRGIRGSSGFTPNSSTSRCWSCWPICGRTDSRPSSSRAAASNSCGPGPSGSMAFRPSRSSDRRIKTKFEMRDGMPVLVPAAGNQLRRRQGGQAGRHQRVHRPPADRRLRQFGRRSRNAAMDDHGGRAPLRAHRPSHRRRARIRLRPPDRTFGRLDKALDAAAVNGWIVVDMKQDWKRIFAFS